MVGPDNNDRDIETNDEDDIDLRDGGGWEAGISHEDFGDSDD